MPTRCVACHTDQTKAWAANYVAPRPGMGVGAEGYAGSARCSGCHDDLYLSWHDTLHARIIQNPATDPQAIVADFDVEDPDLTFGRDDVQYVIGNRRRQVFLTEVTDVPETAAVTETVALTGTADLTRTADLTGTAELTGTTDLTATVDLTATTDLTATADLTGTAEVTGTTEVTGTPEAHRRLVLLPAQWTVATGTWDPLYNETDGVPGEDWLASCAGCHVTGMDTTTGGFTEFGVGCESCHGPSAAHAEDPLNVKPYAEPDEQVCGACHSRGESPDGHPYPTDYQPGDDLTDHFTFTQDESAVWADGSARKNHQQYMDWRLGSTMEQASNTSCTTCHQMHDRGEVGCAVMAAGECTVPKLS